MQSKEFIPKNTAQELLSKSLQELNGQKEEGDTKRVADKTGLTVKTIEVYLGGAVANTETGKEIFKALKKLISARENTVKRLVA